MGKIAARLRLYPAELFSVTRDADGKLTSPCGNVYFPSCLPASSSTYLTYQALLFGRGFSVQLDSNEVQFSSVDVCDSIRFNLTYRRTFSEPRQLYIDFPKLMVGYFKKSLISVRSLMSECRFQYAHRYVIVPIMNASEDTFIRLSYYDGDNLARDRVVRVNDIQAYQDDGEIGVIGIAVGPGYDGNTEGKQSVLAFALIQLCPDKYALETPRCGYCVTKFVVGLGVSPGREIQAVFVNPYSISAAAKKRREQSDCEHHESDGESNIIVAEPNGDAANNTETQEQNNAQA